MSEVLFVGFLSVHLLAMNLASAGPLVCIAIRRNSPEVGRRLAWHSVGALLLGILLGGGLLFVPASDLLWDAVARFPTRSLWHAGSELVFSLVCLVAYAATWDRLKQRPRWHALLAIVSATNLLYHFPPMMVVLGKLAANPAWTLTPVIDRPALRQLMLRGDVLALSIHFVLASIAVAGVTGLLLVARRGESAWDVISVKRAAQVSAGIALAATGLQLPAGLWLLATMSHVSRGAVMGASPLASLMFLAAILLALPLAGRLLALTMGHARHNEARRVGWLMVCVVLLMTASLRTSRTDRSAVAEPEQASQSAIQSRRAGTGP